MDTKKEEFIATIEKNKGIIFKICNTYCRDNEDKKDLAQDIIIELWRSFDKYKSEYKFSTWMYRIALNVAISYYRKSLTKKKHISSLDFDFINIAQQETEENEEEIGLLNDFINQLDEMNKALMILYLEGNSYREIGEILNITASNVGTKIGRIKKILRGNFQNMSK